VYRAPVRRILLHGFAGDPASWDDVPVELLPMAAMAMEAHLEKLEEEGRLPGDLTE